MLTMCPLVWLAKTVDVDYIKMRGWKEVILQNVYRKEFVAGNLAEHATSGRYFVSVSGYIPHVISQSTRRRQSALEMMTQIGTSWSTICGGPCRASGLSSISPCFSSRRYVM